MAGDDHSTKGVVCMLHSKQGKMLVAVLVLALVVIATAIAVSKPDTQVAQVPPPGMGVPSPGPMPGGQGPGGPMPMGPPPGGAGFRPGQMGMMGGGGMMPQMPAITATAEAVYVIQGNTLYKYDKNLSFLKKVELPRPVPTNPMDGPGAPPMSNPNTP